MRARAGDAPRTMTQKILAAHDAEARGGRGAAADGRARVRVDQFVFARDESVAPPGGGASEPPRPRAPAASLAVVHAARVVTGPGAPALDVATLAARGFSVGRPGAGFADVVHLERFASPARLALTDSLCFASQGGVGLLALSVGAEELARALDTGEASVPVPCALHVKLSGRLRAFVSARDVALELLRVGVAEEVRALAERTGRPVVLELGGPALRFLSVNERATIASMAPILGALAGLFPADERTVVFLRNQRRSKAHRVLSPDEGAPYDATVTLDLGAIDPLVREPDGGVRAVRELSRAEVSQVILGGEVGVSGRELAIVAALLRAKRVPDGLDFLVAPSSRQVLEVAAKSGALAALVATGARIVEPDARLLTGELYPPRGRALSLVSWVSAGATPGRLTASAETLAFAVANGRLGDPRAWKRPPRITMPRVLPTDDVLLVRGKPRER